MPSTEKDLTLLSGYIDEQLTEQERASLELRLKADAGLRADLESMRATVALLKQAERLRVPRNFTLDPKAYGKPARPSWWGQLGLSFTPLASAASMIAVVMILGGGFVLLTSANSMRQMTGAAGPAADTAMIAPEEAPFAAGAAPIATEAPAETELTQMVAEATEAAPPPEAASGEAPPSGGAGGGVTYSPTAASAPPAVLPSPSDNMRTADSASANSTTGGEAPQTGIAASTPKMGGENDTAQPEEQLESGESQPSASFELSMPLLGGGLIALGLAILAVVLVTRRK
jgi:hypothetical protein